MNPENKVQIYPNEEFREIELPHKLKLRYAISNKGRLLSFKDNIEDGRILKGRLTDGYRLFPYKIYENSKIYNKHLFYYKLVAKYFLPEPNENQIHLLHLDRVRDNDDYKNLKWATREEMLEHTRKSPAVIEAKKKLIEFKLNSDGSKLTTTKVIHIKKLLANPNQKNRLKMIAKQFGVSEMQIRRIKSGENWSRIQI